MSEFFLKSISDEYDDDGNYIGNSEEGNRFHGVEASNQERHLICAACGSSERRDHIAGGTICGSCGCGESQWSSR